MIWNCTLSKWHFWGRSPQSVEVHGTHLGQQISPRSAATARDLIQWGFMEPISARRSHHGLLPPRAISFTRGSWNLSRPADFTTVCGHRARSHSVRVHGTHFGPQISPRSAAPRAISFSGVHGTFLGLKTGVLCENLHVTAFTHSCKFTLRELSLKEIIFNVIIEDRVDYTSAFWKFIWVYINIIWDLRKTFKSHARHPVYDLTTD